MISDIKLYNNLSQWHKGPFSNLYFYGSIINYIFFPSLLCSLLSQRGHILVAINITAYKIMWKYRNYQTILKKLYNLLRRSFALDIPVSYGKIIVTWELLENFILFRNLIIFYTFRVTLWKIATMVLCVSIFASLSIVKKKDTVKLLPPNKRKSSDSSVTIQYT